MNSLILHPSSDLCRDATPMEDPAGIDRSEIAADCCLRVGELRVALRAYDDHTPTNVRTVRHRPGKFVSVDIGVHSQSEHFCRAPADRWLPGLWVGELREFFARPQLLDNEVTNVRGLRSFGAQGVALEILAGEFGTFCIEGGNSSTDDVGFVAYVKATTKTEALAKLAELSAPKHHSVTTVKWEGIEICFYINPAKLNATRWE